MMLADLKNDLTNKTVQEVYNKYLLGQDVWLFRERLQVSNPYKTYDDFKFLVSKNLKIHFNNIAIIGSSKTGISFSPGKKFKRFDETSDLDVILVSQKHYDSLWQAYLDMYYKQIPIPESTFVHKSLFKGFISLKEPTAKHAIIKEWLKLVSPMLKDLQIFFGIDIPINYRIYNSWEAVEKYHHFGIKQLKNFIDNNSEKEKLISQIISSLKRHKDGHNK